MKFDEVASLMRDLSKISSRWLMVDSDAIRAAGSGLIELADWMASCDISKGFTDHGLDIPLAVEMRMSGQAKINGDRVGGDADENRSY